MSSAVNQFNSGLIFNVNLHTHSPVPSVNTFIYLHSWCISEKPCSKSLEHNVVYIPIITMSHVTSHDFK